MKKILLFVVALMSATMMQAGLGLSVEGNVIERDTTITVNHLKYAGPAGEADGAPDRYHRRRQSPDRPCVLC